MKLAAFFDISTFIWDEAHFMVNTKAYYDLMLAVPAILEKLVDEQIPVLLRGELLSEIQTHFPYEIIPSEHFDFQYLTLRYLTKLNVLDYQACVSYSLSCNPNLIRDYFRSLTQEEVKHLIHYVYYTEDMDISLLASAVLGNNFGNLKIKNGSEKEIIVKFFDNPKEHEAIVRTLMNIFEHNPKHGKIERYFEGKVISPFRYYDSRTGDITKAQSLLNKSTLLGTDYYTWEPDEDVFVRFLNTEGNKYHGFEFIPDEALGKLIKQKMSE
jgi:hypothetical protein